MQINGKTALMGKRTVDHLSPVHFIAVKTAVICHSLDLLTLFIIFNHFEAISKLVAYQIGNLKLNIVGVVIFD